MTRHEAGGAAVELAVMAPILILLCLGVIEIGRYENVSIKMVNAARAGVQYGAQSLVTASNDAGMQQAALADGENASGLSAIATHICQCSDGSASTCLSSDCPAPLHRIVWVKVTTTGSFNSLLSVPGIPSSIAVGSTAVMRSLQQ